LGELLRRTGHYAWLALYSAICSAVYVLPLAAIAAVFA